MNYFIHLSCCVCLLWVGGKWSDHCLLPFIKKNTAEPPLPRSRVASRRPSLWCALTLSNTRTSVHIFYSFYCHQPQSPTATRRSKKSNAMSNEFLYSSLFTMRYITRERPECHCSPLLFDRRRSTHLRLLLFTHNRLFISLPWDVQFCLSWN